MTYRRFPFLLIFVVIVSCGTTPSKEITTRISEIRVWSRDYYEVQKFHYDDSKLNEIDIDTAWRFSKRSTGDYDTGGWQIPNNIAESFRSSESVEIRYAGDAVCEVDWVPGPNKYVDFGVGTRIRKVTFSGRSARFQYVNRDGNPESEFIEVPYHLAIVQKVK